MKKIIYIIIILVVILILFPSLLQRVLPYKSVQIGEEFALRKGQTAKFSENKYITHCGFSGNGMTVDYKPLFSWKIKGVKYPCTERSFSYTSFDKAPCNTMGTPCGPYRPYDVTFHNTGDKENPTLIKVQDSSILFNHWTAEILRTSCDTAYINSRPLDEKIACYKLNVFNLGNPQDCKIQNIISEKECLTAYVENFRNECTTRKEQHEIGSATWVAGIENQDDCLKEKIISRHLSSENCTLLIEDNAKRQSCLEERLKEENYFNSLRSE